MNAVGGLDGIGEGAAGLFEGLLDNDEGARKNHSFFLHKKN